MGNIDGQTCELSAQSSKKTEINRLNGSLIISPQNDLLF